MYAQVNYHSEKTTVRVFINLNQRFILIFETVNFFFRSNDSIAKLKGAYFCSGSKKTYFALLAIAFPFNCIVVLALLLWNFQATVKSKQVSTRIQKYLIVGSR